MTTIQTETPLPRVRVQKDYTFDSTNGPVRLADLFQNRSQLLATTSCSTPTGSRAAAAAPMSPTTLTVRCGTWPRGT